MGVPSNPKCSRILLTRNRSYEKWNVVAMFVKKTKVGGAMPICATYMIFTLRRSGLTGGFAAMIVSTNLLRAGVGTRLRRFAAALSSASSTFGARSPVSEVMRDGGRTGSAGRARTRLRSALVVTQVAVSFVLLVCGGLFIRSARSAAKMDLGFSRDRLLLAQSDLQLHRLDEVQSRQTQDRLVEAIAVLPGVEAVALSTHIPLSGNYSTQSVVTDERTPLAPEWLYSAAILQVSPGSQS